MTIHRFDVAISDDETEIRLPADAQVVHAGMCSNTEPGSISIWTMLADGVYKTKRRFRVIGTGHPAADGLTYVGTVVMDYLVWHVMEAS
jgi:hypothetical protein